MQEHRTFISLIHNLNLGQIPHYKPKDARTSNFYQFGRTNGFKAKFPHYKPWNAGTSNLYKFAPKNLFGPNST